MSQITANWEVELLLVELSSPAGVLLVSRVGPVVIMLLLQLLGGREEIRGQGKMGIIGLLGGRERQGRKGGGVTSKRAGQIRKGEFCGSVL